MLQIIERNRLFGGAERRKNLPALTRVTVPRRKRGGLGGTSYYYLSSVSEITVLGVVGFNRPRRTLPGIARTFP